MNSDKLEKIVLKYLTQSLPCSLRKTWPLFFLLVVTLFFFSRTYIETIPQRFEVRAIIKTGKIEKRSYKSKILDDMEQVSNDDAIEYAVGLSSADLEILLRGKYMNHRSKLKSVFDSGPFITDISVPRNSKLIVIKSESVSRDTGEDVVKIVIDDLKQRFNKEKEKIEAEVKKRLLIIKSDHRKIKSQLSRVNEAIREIGFSPILSKQKIDLLNHETKLRYMLIDIEGQLNSDKLSQFQVLSIKPSKYPVTTRKAVYYCVVLLFSCVLYVILFLGVGIFLMPSIPPSFTPISIKGELL